MPLQPGVRIGPYEVTGALGAGGMGEVYRARDSRLNREVALKLLPGAFATDAERLARFTREAQTLASLNHPNIAQIYGFEDDASHRALAMELVDGPTLRELLASRPGRRLPADEAVPIARQIAEALEAAHEAGVIHRDLKPANIKVRPDGTVKVLDFGLAKAFGPEGTSATEDETVTSPAITQDGVILGTAAYMSPEQAKGRPVDRRADIWAFGAVLFEMLSGNRLFGGKTVPETMAAVIKDPTRLDRLPSSTPPSLRRIIERCLERDPKLRLRDIGEARIALTGGGIDAPATVRSSRLPLIVAGVALAAATAVGGWLVGSRSATSSAEQPLVVDIVPTPAAFPRQRAARLFTFAPDGTLIYAAGVQGERKLYKRDRDSNTGVPITGTEGAYGPFVSPDDKWIGFFADAYLKRVPIAGGAAQVIHKLDSPDAPDRVGLSWAKDSGYGATWLPGDTIVYGRWGGKLWRIPAIGGTPVPVELDLPGDELSHRLPFGLPGGKVVLFTVVRALTTDEESSVEALDLITGKRTHLIDDATDGRYAQGRLLFARHGALYSVAFDPDTLVASGEQKRISPDVMHAIGSAPASASGVAQFDVSPDGALAILGGGVTPFPPQKLIVVSSSGQELITPDVAFAPRFSPDGSHVAAWDSASGKLKVYDLASRPTSTSLLKAGFPLWRDASSLFVTSKNQIYSVTLDGVLSREPVVKGRYLLAPSAVSKDGKWLAYIEQNLKTGNDVWVVDLQSGAKTPVATGPGSETHASFSPDARWILYASDEESSTDEPDIYVRPFPGPGQPKRLTRGGARMPLWSFDGREIFYMVSARETYRIMRVSVDIRSDGVYLGQERVAASGAFGGNSPAGGFDVSRDGHIVADVMLPVAASETAPAILRLILHADLSGGE